MLKSVSMALTPDEKERESRPYSEPAPLEEVNDYPYGLTIHLSANELKKLGFARGTLVPGDRLNIVGVGMVTSSHAETKNTIDTFSAGIQFQQLGIEKIDKPDNRAAALFGEGT